MNEILSVIMRTILMVVILFFLTKFMGKKQISQLNFFDYIIGITIGSIVADVALDLEKDMLLGIVSLVCFAFVSVFMSFVVMKSIRLRRFLVGVPTILIENNKIPPVKVIGYDAVQNEIKLPKRITSIASNKQKIAEQAVKLMLDKAESGKTVSTIIKVKVYLSEGTTA